jgi:hypothetical protein
MVFLTFTTFIQFWIWTLQVGKKKHPSTMDVTRNWSFDTQNHFLQMQFPTHNTYQSKITFKQGTSFTVAVVMWLLIFPYILWWLTHSLLLSMFFPFETAHMLNHFISTKRHEGSRNHLVCSVNVRAFTQCRKEQDGETNDPFLHKQLLERLRKITRKLQSVYIPHLISTRWANTDGEIWK